MDFKQLAVFLYFVGCVQLGETTGNNTTHAHALWEELFITRGYNNKIRPVLDVDNATEVFVDLYLKNIHYFDEVSGVLKVSCYMFVEWLDDFLPWGETQFGNIELMRLSQEAIWRPDLIHYNSVNSYKSLGHSTLHVECDYMGWVAWDPMEVFETSCPVDMTYFPFDIQTCTLEFMSWSYTNDQVILSSYSNTTSLRDFVESPQWEILSTSVSVKNDSAGTRIDLIVFTIRIQRKSQYYLLSLFLPIILLSVLNIFIFTVPSDGGERSGYAVTIVLSFAVFLTIVETTMPANSEKVSLFSVYIMVQTIHSTLITVISLLVIRCASLDERTQIPKVLIKVIGLSRFQCKKTVPDENRLKKNSCENNCTIEEIDDNDCSMDDSYTWKMVSNAVDRLCFIVFTTIFSFTTVVGFIVLAMAPK